MRMAIFDYETVRTNPFGLGHLRCIEALGDEHDITVYSVNCAAEAHRRVRWRRVPAIRRPLAALYVTFHLAAALRLWIDRRRGERYDVVQTIDSASFGANIVYAQFCHRAYLREQWATSRPSGLRRIARWVFEALAAALEGPVLGRARLIVVPSEGLRREIESCYPQTCGRIRVVPNAVEPERMRAPADLDRDALRDELSLPRSVTLLVFVALGHYERKGLPIVLDALEGLDDDTNLVVVGGTSQQIAPYRRRLEERDLADRVHFAGASSDVRPYLWVSDAFVFPSAYETFSYVSYEAAAAGLPLVVTELYGVEEFMVDGKTGFVVDRDAASVAAAITELVAAGPDGRRTMGECAAAAVAGTTVENYVGGWSSAYREVIEGSRVDAVGSDRTTEVTR